jgi:hypothetical protein
MLGLGAPVPHSPRTMHSWNVPTSGISHGRARVAHVRPSARPRVRGDLQGITAEQCGNTRQEGFRGGTRAVTHVQVTFCRPLTEHSAWLVSHRIP